MVKYDERVSLMEHLAELRSRLVRAAIALAVGVGLAIAFNDFVFSLLLGPLDSSGIPESARKITTFSPSEPFMVSLRVWIYVGIILASPVIIYQFWAFVGPAFAPTHRRQVIPVVAVCASLFIGGVVFAYLFVLPRGLEFLLGFNEERFQVQNRAADYFSFAAWFLVAFGAIFEMPIVLLGLIKLEVIGTEQLTRHWRVAVVIMAVVAMVATPSQDPVSMMLMLAPLLILYAASIVIGKMIERRRPHAAVADSG
jgi:sec-independent protein translocase protein TatC